MSPAGNVIEQRLKSLESHLEQENPVLLSAVKSFRTLDRIGHRMGLLAADESFATQIPWWPLISILGTFSSGKSTFINHYLDYRLQRTGNQAVDDRFTVISYSKEPTPHALPGVALDSDPRFPFYKISNEIELVARGEGDRIDAYLQLKTCPSEQLRGKIIIDSPGFDADAQRDSTLRITDHIIDLSDLVLVFFDARHPEPGAMRDTLRHLVANTIRRNDSGKFLYILNQIDTAARENNPEDVIAAWQRALGEQGLTAGRFFAIYNPDAAVPIDDPALRARFELKRDQDLHEIHSRLREVEIERAYRIVGALEKTARDIGEKAVPRIGGLLERWRRRVLAGDALGLGLYLALLLWGTVSAGYWQGLSFQPAWLQGPAVGLAVWVSLVLLIAIGVAIHFGIRSLAARGLLRGITDDVHGVRGSIRSAFRRNTRWWRPLFARRPVGWGRGAQKRLQRVLHEVDGYIQTLNDRFTSPSGADLVAPRAPGAQSAPEPEAEEPARTQAEGPVARTGG